MLELFGKTYHSSLSFSSSLFFVPRKAPHLVAHAKNQPVVSAQHVQSSSDLNKFKDSPQGASPTVHLTKIPRLPYNQALLVTTRVHVVGPSGLTMIARALIDQCSQVSVISRSLCQRLRLKIKPAHVPICGLGSETTAVFSESAIFTIRPRFESTFSHSVQALVLPRISAYSPPTIRSSSEMSHISGLNLADPNFMDPGHIDLLLGAAIHARIVEGQVVRGKENEPIATCSLLGWLLSGNVPRIEEKPNFSLVAFHCAELPSLNEALQRFWNVEELPTKVLHSSEKQECENHFVSTYSRDSSGRYIVRLPFKSTLEGVPSLSDSHTTALRLLQRMEVRFEKDEKLRVAYHDFMSEYRILNHMIPSYEAEVLKKSEECFFLPHHGVWKEFSSTTKL